MAVWCGYAWCSGVDTALDELVRKLERILAGKASVSVSDLVVSIDPVNPRALRVGWINWGDELILEAGQGGRWELPRTIEEIEFIEAMVFTIAAGEATEVATSGRCWLEVRLASGSLEHSSVAQAPAGCVPLPFWPCGRHQRRYEPY